jgi:DNA-binding Lrp family transcriptional regulator
MGGNLAKSSKETILQDEMKVLDILEQNSKDSVDGIAKRSGLSRQKVWRIIKDLENRKVIWGYAAVTDEEMRCLKHFILLVKRTNVPFDDTVRQEVTFDKLDNYPSGLIKIENIYLTHGISDWVLTFYASDIRSAKKFVEHTFRRLSKYIQEYFIIETLFPVRKQGMKNPKMKQLVEYL